VGRVIAGRLYAKQHSGAASPQAGASLSTTLPPARPHIAPLFATQRANVSVLPDVKAVQHVFGSYDVAATHGLAARPAALRAAAADGRANTGGS